MSTKKLNTILSTASIFIAIAGFAFGQTAQADAGHARARPHSTAKAKHSPKIETIHNCPNMESHQMGSMPMPMPMPKGEGSTATPPNMAGHDMNSMPMHQNCEDMMNHQIDSNPLPSEAPKSPITKSTEPEPSEGNNHVH